MKNLLLRIILLIVWIITAYFTFTGNMMMGMYWMAGGMLLEAITNLVLYFLKKETVC